MKVDLINTKCNKMPDQIYSAEQIRIPLLFPEILKSYSKHIIGLQPDDIISASVEYFTNIHKQRSLRNKGPEVRREVLESLFFKFQIRGTTVLQREVVEEIAILSQFPLELVQEIYKYFQLTQNRKLGFKSELD